MSEDANCAGVALDKLIDLVFSDTTKRLTMQGSAEIANTLYNGSAFVPYGQGQVIRSGRSGADTADLSETQQLEAGQDQPQQAVQQVLDGREM